MFGGTAVTVLAAKTLIACSLVVRLIVARMPIEMIQCRMGEIFGYWIRAGPKYHTDNRPVAIVLALTSTTGVAGLSAQALDGCHRSGFVAEIKNHGGAGEASAQPLQRLS
tara:strand:+ start:63 stop:392 length:330 start_codon:yes stop_codon:yes gene_type:complete